jgi:hypothetical protein
MNGQWMRGISRLRKPTLHAWGWWLGIVSIVLALVAVVSGTPYLSEMLTGTLTIGTQDFCAAEGGFGIGPNAYISTEQGVLSGVTFTSACGSSGSAFSSVSVTLNPYAGARNITSIDALRFYWNGSTSASVTFSVSSSGTSFFTSSGPYGYFLLNSTTSGSYPIHNTDDCLGTVVSSPGTGVCTMQFLPVPAGVAGAVAASGTTGNTVTGLVNLSQPTTIVCPPAGSAWNSGASSCTSGIGGAIVSTLSAGPSFLVISFGFSNAPSSYPSGSSSFAITVTASVVW